MVAHIAFQADAPALGDMVSALQPAMDARSAREEGNITVPHDTVNPKQASNNFQDEGSGGPPRKVAGAAALPRSEIAAKRDVHGLFHALLAFAVLTVVCSAVGPANLRFEGSVKMVAHIAFQADAPALGDMVSALQPAMDARWC